MPKSTSRDSLLARSLEPFVASLWILFALVSLAVGAIWTFGIGEGLLEKAVSNPDLRAALVWLLAHTDLGWIVLAAAIVYFNLANSVGLATARQWAILILGVVVAAAWVSVATGIPFGHIRYGAALGMKLGPVPVGLPLFWFAAIIGAREALLSFRPRIHQAALAAGVAILGFLTDFNLEPIAARWRGFWFWTDDAPNLPPIFEPPLTGSIAWGILAGLCVLAMREPQVADTARKRPWQSAATFFIFHVVFLSAQITHHPAPPPPPHRPRHRRLQPAATPVAIISKSFQLLELSQINHQELSKSCVIRGNYEIGTTSVHQARLQPPAGTSSGRAGDGAALD